MDTKLNQRTIWLILTGLFLITFLLYLPTIQWTLEKETLTRYVYPQVFDLIKNPFFLIIFNSADNFVRPMFALSLYVNILFWGFDALGYRLANLFFNFVSVLGIYALGRLIFEKSSWALLAAAFFAFHPNAYYAITAKINGVSDLLPAMFVLWGLYCWGKFLLSESGRNKWFFLAFILFVFGLLSKEIAITFPLIALALHLTFNLQSRIKNIKLRRYLLLYGGFVLILGLYWLFRIQTLGGVGGYVGLSHLTVSSITFRNLFRVMNGAFFVERNLAHPIFGPTWIVGSIAALVILIYGLRWRKRGSPHWSTAFGFVFMFLSGAALLNFSWAGWWCIYVPLVGFAIGFAGLLREVTERIKIGSTITRGVMIILPAIMILLTSIQVQGLIRNEMPRQRLFQMIKEKYEPLGGTTLYIWERSEKDGLMMSFDSKSDVTGTRFANYPEPPSGLVIMMSDTDDDRILIGYLLKQPYQIDLTSGNQLVSLEYQNGIPVFSSLNQQMLEQDLTELYGNDWRIMQDR